MAYIVMAHKNMAYIVVPQAADEPEAAARMRAKAALLQVTERAYVRACVGACRSKRASLGSHNYIGHN